MWYLLSPQKKKQIIVSLLTIIIGMSLAHSLVGLVFGFSQ